MTGGGTAGHVTPNIALMPALKEAGYEIEYIGSINGMEKGLIEAQNIPYHGISSGKLRRYFDWKNFSDPFRVLKGYGQAISLMKKLKPDVVFSKGGFVSVPVVLAARHCHIPAIIHESDITPGLANKIAIKGAKKVCCNFPETMKYLPPEKAVLTGSPIRQELFKGNPQNALHLCNFPDHSKPVLLIIGGSLGSRIVNEAVRTLDNARKDILKSPCVLLPPAARHKLLYGVKFLLRDYPLMGVWYHFPFFGQLRGAFLAFHVGCNPLVACKVARIYRAS